MLLREYSYGDRHCTDSGSDSGTGTRTDASKLLLYYIWEMAFAFFDAPHAAALTILVLAVLCVVAAVQFLYLDRRTHYQ